MVCRSHESYVSMQRTVFVRAEPPPKFPKPRVDERLPALDRKYGREIVGLLRRSVHIYPRTPLFLISRSGPSCVLSYRRYKNKSGTSEVLVSCPLVSFV